MGLFKRKKKQIKVGELIEIISKQTNIPESSQRLIFQGRALAVEKYLNDYSKYLIYFFLN